MTGMGIKRITWAAAAFLLAGLVAAHGQSSPAGSIEPAALVKELGLPQKIAEQVLELTDRFIGQALETSKALDAVLSRQKTEAPLDGQASAKVRQIQKELGLRLQRFELDLADVAGETSAATLVGRVKAALPKVLVSAEAGPSNAGATPGMSGPAASPRMQIAQRLLSTNSLIVQLLATLATSSAPSDVVQGQRQLLQQMLINQAAMLQRLAAVSAR